MREQVELTFLIGLPVLRDWHHDPRSAQNAFRRRIIETACRLCGGCAVIPTNGYWMQDGASHAETFSGKLEEEGTLHIKLSCELDKEERVYETLRNAISAWANLLYIDTTWVHVQRSTFTGMHFSTKDTVAGMSRATYRDIVSPGTRLAHK